MDITQLLAFGVEQGASDCHLSSGEPPMLRINGDLKKLEHASLSREDVHAMIYDIMSDADRKAAAAYGVLKPDGKGIQRSVVLVVKDGKVRFAARGMPGAQESLRGLQL